MVYFWIGRHSPSSPSVPSWQTSLASMAGDDGSLDSGLERIAHYCKGLFRQIPPSVALCPVCYSVPSKPEEWHIMSSCGHSTCVDCFRTYAVTLVRDTNHSGYLRCPVCPKQMRSEDAVVALENNPPVLQLLDLKLRDEALRKMPGYRLCENCNKPPKSQTPKRLKGVSGQRGKNRTALETNRQGDNDSDTFRPIVGGGFATAKCVGDHMDAKNYTWWVFVGLFLSAVPGAMSIMESTKSSEALENNHPFWSTAFGSTTSQTILNFFTFNIVLHIFELIRTNIGISEGEEARLERFGPTSVGCPCCEENFPLNGMNLERDPGTNKWMKTNSKYCPKCNVPIQKNGGCRVMRCSHCRTQFCWGCMEAGISHFQHVCRLESPCEMVGNLLVPFVIFSAIYLFFYGCRVALYECWRGLKDGEGTE